jgi:hypothetical protein
MHNINVYRTRGIDSANISQLPVKRDWMDETSDAHAYRCFPVTLTNSLGWGLSFPEDISFVWDGISDTSPDHVKILSGEKYVHANRANGTISFNTGLMFKTKEDLTMFQMPVPNMFWEGAQAFSTLISTSFFSGELPCAWRITKPMSVITIKANQPFIALVPISLSGLQDSEIILDDVENMTHENKYDCDPNEHIETVNKIVASGKWTNFYRDAIDYKGNKVGSHEVKSLRLHVKDINEKD